MADRRDQARLPKLLAQAKTRMSAPARARGGSRRNSRSTGRAVVTSLHDRIDLRAARRALPRDAAQLLPAGRTQGTDSGATRDVTRQRAPTPRNVPTPRPGSVSP